jgi:hypothetical protein
MGCDTPSSRSPTTASRRPFGREATTLLLRRTPPWALRARCSSLGATHLQCSQVLTNIQQERGGFGAVLAVARWLLTLAPRHSDRRSQTRRGSVSFSESDAVQEPESECHRRRTGVTRGDGQRSTPTSSDEELRRNTAASPSLTGRPRPPRRRRPPADGAAVAAHLPHLREPRLLRLEHPQRPARRFPTLDTLDVPPTAAWPPP